MRSVYLAVLLCATALIGTAAHAGGVGCDVGIYSHYVNGTGGIAGKYHEPVVQGACRKTFENGVYVEGWVSQSLRNPGLRDTFANELDATLGFNRSLGKYFSYEAHVAHFAIANDSLTDLNGHLENVGGVFRYHLSADTTVYLNAEQYLGVGTRGLPDGWKAGVGVRSIAGPLTVDAVVYHNEFLISGHFAKVVVEPTKPIAKFYGGGFRPQLQFWQPIGQYPRSQHVVVGGHLTF